MKIPKYLRFYLTEFDDINVTETGELTATTSPILDIIKLLTRSLGCSYKLFPVKSHKLHVDGLYVGVPITGVMHRSLSYPYDYRDVAFATEHPPFAVNTFAPLHPFTWGVWIGLLLCIILASLTHFLIFWRRVPLISTFFYIIGTLFGEQHNWRPKSLAQNMLTLTWCTGIMFITLSYGSVLLSFLTVPVRGKGITNLDDLYEAVRLKQATAVTFEGTTDMFLLNESEDTKLRFIGKHTAFQNKLNQDIAMQGIPKNVVVIGSRRLLCFTFVDDKYFISEDPIMHSYIGIFSHGAFLRGIFHYENRINDFIHRLWESGINRKVFEDFLFRKRLSVIFKYKDLMTAQDPIRPLRLADLSGAFYVLVIGHILGLICLVFEFVAHHRKVKFQKCKS